MKPYQKPHPPIGVAATSLGSTSIRIAGERGWLPMSSSLLAPVHLKGHWQMVAQGAASAGRVADRRAWRIARDICVVETSAACTVSRAWIECSSWRQGDGGTERQSEEEDHSDAHFGVRV